MSDSIVKKEKSGLFSMSSPSKVVDFNTFRKAPEQFITGKSLKSGESVKKVAGDKDYKKLIKSELMMEALKEAGVSEEQTAKVVSILEKKTRPVGLKQRLDEKKEKDEKEAKLKKDKEAKLKKDKKEKEEKEAKLKKDKEAKLKKAKEAKK